MRKRPALILISGPARAGKSRFGRYLSGWLKADHFALSDKLKQMTHLHYGIGHCRVMEFEDCKDEPRREFHGKTPRQAYIDFSEGILKPCLGSGWLGTFASERVAGNLSKGVVSVISGVGFVDEVQPLIQCVGAERCLHICVLPGSNLPNDISDSRERLDLETFGVPVLRLAHTTPLEFVERIREHLGACD